MAASISQVRKKRNFKGLGLDVSQPSPVQPEPEPLPIPSRVAPTRLKLGTNGNTANTEKPLPQVAATASPSVGSATPKKKRPGPLSLGAPKPGIGVPSVNAPIQPIPKTHLDESGMLTIPAQPNSAPATGSTPSASPFRSNYQNTLTQQLEALSLGQVAMKADDLKEVGDLGSGNSGSVKKVLHGPTGTTMAKKVFTAYSFDFVC